MRQVQGRRTDKEGGCIWVKEGVSGVDSSLLVLFLRTLAPMLQRRPKASPRNGSNESKKARWWQLKKNRRCGRRLSLRALANYKIANRNTIGCRRLRMDILAQLLHQVRIPFDLSSLITDSSHLMVNSQYPFKIQPMLAACTTVVEGMCKFWF